MTTRDDETDADGKDGTHDDGAFGWSAAGEPEPPAGSDDRGEPDGADGPRDSGAADGDPFAELGDGDGDASTSGSFPDDSLDDVFDMMEVDELDGEAVWDALDADLPAETEFPRPDAAETDAVGTPESIDADSSDQVVDKRTYCQRCPYFAAPPETTCTHETASIVEVVGSGQFRVRNCPMVGEGGPRFTRRE